MFLRTWAARAAFMGVALASRIDGSLIQPAMFDVARWRLVRVAQRCGSWFLLGRGEECGFDGGLVSGDAGGVGPVDPSAHPQGERVGLGLEHDGGAERDGADRVGRQDRDLAQRAAGGGGGVDGEGVGGAAGGGEPVVPFPDEGGQVAQVTGVVGAAEDELDLGGGEDGGGVVGAVAGADLGEGLEDRDDGEVLAAAVG